MLYVIDSTEFQNLHQWTKDTYGRIKGIHYISGEFNRITYTHLTKYSSENTRNDLMESKLLLC